MHPQVEEMIAKGKALGLEIKEIGERAGIKRETLTKWVNDAVTPRKTSLKKVKAMIKKFDSGEITGPLSTDEQLPNLVIQEDWPEERKEMYRRIHKLEREYGSFTNVPYEDEGLSELHNHLGVQKIPYNEDGTTQFSKVKLEKLREEHNLNQPDMSKIVGNSRNWYNKFKGTRDFPEEYAIKFAEYFGIDLEELVVGKTKESAKCRGRDLHS